MHQNLTDPFILANGKAIPCLGFGTWKTPDGEDTYRSVKTALQMTAIIYCCVFHNVLGLILSIAVAAVTIYSGVEYFWQLKDLFTKDLKS